MAMWNDYEKLARRLDRIANAFERIANALETANIIEADRKTEPQKWETPPKAETKGVNTNCVSAIASAVETMSCQECKHWDNGCTADYFCSYEPKTEPQTERSE